MAEYAVTLLENVLGAPGVRAQGLNDKGQITGHASLPGGGYHAFLYDAGDVTDLGTLKGGSVSWGSDLNDAGQVCGWAETANHAGTRAFLWTNGVMKDLGSIGGDSSIGCAVNKSGQVAGWSTSNGSGLRAFRWTNGVMQDLGTIDGNNSVGLDLNDAGDVVGQVGAQAFIYSGGSMTALKPFNVANAIDNAGELVGDGEAFFRDSIGTVTLAPGADGDVTPSALNDSKRVVGSVKTNGSYYACRWDVGTQELQNLNDLVDPLENGDSLRVAWDINHTGQIVGETEQGLGFLLTPIVKKPNANDRLAYIYILAGIIGGGGGVVFTPGGGIQKKPDPVDPWLRSTWSAMSPAKRDMLLAMALDEVASLVANPKARRDLQKSARSLLKTSAGSIASGHESVGASAGNLGQSNILKKFQR
jgi:probable HAF family extracellular repeat protein